MKNTLLCTAVLSTLALASANAVAHETGDILVRAGFTTVAPDGSSSNIQVGGADFGLPLGTDGANVLLGGIDVDNNTQLGLNIAYFLTDNINVELLAATPFTHDMEILGGTKLGSTKHLPPTVTVNYYFADPAAKFQPYVGAGLNYTIFFDEKFDQGAVDLVAANAGGAEISNLDVDASFGLSAQIGADYEISEGVYLNASVRYINIETEATFDVAGAPGGTVDNVKINPFVYTLSVGYKF
ncbi:MAG: OmpW family outer membrane protein [Glaciecola sp.]